MVCVMVVATILPTKVSPAFADPVGRQQFIPILGVTTGEPTIKTMAFVELLFRKRSDQSGLTVPFQDGHMAGARTGPVRSRRQRLEHAVSPVGVAAPNGRASAGGVDLLARARGRRDGIRRRRRGGEWFAAGRRARR
ncbi:MAG: hypothetical protein EWM72_02929 [Nitrospira sp.]|nr:MAG: hypothetical protein EWM72_02929 [Nitrospira sp.]